eukprot:gene11446-15334_t
MSEVVDAEIMTIMPLGGGQEVGRSCILLQYQGRNIMLDCGCHPGREGTDGLPFFDALECEPEDIDLILITHFHIDHCAALPYFTEKTNFKGRVFMTHATKAVMKLLLSDNIRLQVKTTPLYTDKDLQSCIDKVEVVDYHQTIEHKGIKFTATAAGHVLGAAMFMIDIDSIRVLYTGDYSLEEDRHLIQAEIPAGGPPDVLIVESTFGVTNLPPRDKREYDFTHTVESIVCRGGSCLIPVFALGRAQELLLILDEYWKDHPELQNIPIFYASKLATKSLRVYQTFINMMNNHIRDLMDQFYNPFQLRYIKSIQNNDFNVLGPCVVMASPGFMQSGVSRQLFEMWCDDDKNGVIIAGYTVEGTLANDLLEYPTEIKCLDNRIKPRKCQIEHVSFSAHVDYTQNKSFIKSITPDYIILVHGEKNQMRRLKEGLESEIRKDTWPSIHKPNIAMPENGMKVKLRFRKSIIADVVGSIATNIIDTLESNNNNSFDQNYEKSILSLPSSTILVTENFSSKVVNSNELSNFTNCKFGKISQKMNIPLPKGIPFQAYTPKQIKSDDVKPRHGSFVLVTMMADALEDVFDVISILHDGTITIQDLVTIKECFNEVNLTESSSTLSHVAIEWSASPVSDTVADCVVGIILQLFSTSNILRQSMKEPKDRDQKFSDTKDIKHLRSRKRKQMIV